MLSRSKMLEDRMNVGPGQYSPVFNYSKEKSPSFRLLICDSVCASNKTLDQKLYPDQGNMNNDHSWQWKRKGMILARTLDQKCRTAECLALDHMNMKMLCLNMVQKWSPVMVLVLDWLWTMKGILLFIQSSPWPRFLWAKKGNIFSHWRNSWKGFKRFFNS